MSSLSNNTPSDVSASNLPSDTEATNLLSDTEASNAEKPNPRLTSAAVSTTLKRIVHVGDGECCICFQVFDNALSPYVFGQCSHCACLNCIQAISLNAGETLCPLCRTRVNSIVAMEGSERTISQTLEALRPSRATSPPTMRSPARADTPPLTMRSPARTDTPPLTMRSPARDESPTPMRSPARVDTVPQQYRPFVSTRNTSPVITKPSTTPVNNTMPASPVKIPTSNGSFLPSMPHRNVCDLSSYAIHFQINYAMSKNPGDLGIVMGNLEGIQAGNRALDVSFLLDVSGSMRNEINNMKNSLTKFVRDCNGKATRISIAIFSAYAHHIVGFTLVTDATIGGIIAQIESQVHAIDSTNLCGGITYIQRLLDNSAREHPLAQLTTLVILTDGKPDGSIFDCKASFSSLMRGYPNLTTSIIALGGNVSLSNLETIRGNYHDQVVLKSARTGAHLDAALNAILEVPPSIGAPTSIRFESGAMPVNREYTVYNNVVTLSAMPISAAILIPFRAPFEELPTISFTAMVMGVPFSGFVCADETISEELRTFYPEEQNARAKIDKVLNQFSTNPAIRKQKLEELKRMIESGGESAFGSYYAPLIASIALHITSATIASNPRISASEKIIVENEAFADRAFSGRSISYQSSTRDISDITDVDFMDAALEDVFPVDAALENVSPVDAAPVDAATANVALVDAAPVDAAPVDAAPVDAAPEDVAPVDAATANVALVDAALVDVATANVAPKDALDMV